MSIESVTHLSGTRKERQLAWLPQAADGHHGGFANLLARAFQLADLDNAMKFAVPTALSAKSGATTR